VGVLEAGIGRERDGLDLEAFSGVGASDTGRVGDFLKSHAPRRISVENPIQRCFLRKGVSREAVHGQGRLPLPFDGILAIP
jgi:hypothetical protein